jgi:hypothetical protein
MDTDEHEFRVWIPALEAETFEGDQFALARRAESAACERAADEWIKTMQRATYRVHVRHLCNCEGALGRVSEFEVEAYRDKRPNRFVTACRTLVDAVSEHKPS